MSAPRSRKDEVAAVTADELRSQLIIKKMVGRGGFAAVFLGTYKGQEVAVKVILAEHVTTKDSVQVKCFLREGQYMARCTHRSIVKCHAVCQLPADFPGIEKLGHTSSTWALVLEYIEGGSLANLLKQQMSQTSRVYNDYQAYCWALDVAEALSYLHNAPRPVMHRDVKADNVLLTVDEESGRPSARLMDFGLMSALDGNKNPMLRRRSVSMGTGDGAGRGGGLGRVSVGAGGGGGRSLAAPSVATYYADTTHEGGKIFYLMEELPATAAAALAGGPGATRRTSMDMGALNASATAAANAAIASAAAAAAAGGGGSMSAATNGSLASRGNSFDTAGGTAGGAKGGRGGGAGAGAAGMLVPLNEEASYHGNTAGYVAMLQHQQEERQKQRAAAAAAAAAAAREGVLGGGGSANTSLSGGLGGGSGSMTGGRNSARSTGAGDRNSPGGVSPGDSGRWPADTVTAAAVRLSMVTEEAPNAPPTNPPTANGGGDAAIALAVAAAAASPGSGPSSGRPPSLLPPIRMRSLSGQDGSLVRLSAPVQAAALQEPLQASGSDIMPLDTPTQSEQQQQSQPQTAAAATPLAATSAPIIAVAKTPDAVAAVADTSNGMLASTSAAPAPLTPSRRTSSDAVPIVDVVGGRPGSAGAGDPAAVALGRRSRLIAAGAAASSSSAPSSSAQVPPMTPLTGGLSAPLGNGGGGADGGLGGTTPPDGGSSAAALMMTERQKSAGLVRIGAVGGVANGSMTGGAVGASRGGGGGGKGLGTTSITTLLQGRYEQDFQWVWRLTGQTGSCMYMAPEVYRNLPYNEKVDVFSFGVLLYEIFSRQLTLIFGLNLRELRLQGQDTPEGYASHVANGYRPPRPQAMPEPLYELISACWAEDPCARPNMTDVVESLRLLQDQFAAEPPKPVAACGCVMS
ncbi:hypothetical protein Agub_g2595 [Astrephomene gubernaculifera]|uniref:Protein kinase domain-containing protein n=1 Tax=Astrephomene gubernaculifera TaxID=47775 RepID=A0AAD3HIE6_9CHLO|nr:hypothetical protein Agub_g2595 [Astrephomene gubernaculifera]